MKRFIAIFVLLALLLSFYPTTFAQTKYFYDGRWHKYDGQVFKLRVNGELLDTQMPPIVFDDYSVVPARDVFEKLGGTVDWDAATKTVSVQAGHTKIKLYINSTVCHVGSAAMIMPIAPKIINEKTMIPVRFVGEMLGYFVDFDSSTDTVIINNEDYKPTKEPVYESTPTPTKEPDFIKITKTSYKEEGGGVVLTLSLSDNAEESAFYLFEPLRLVVDITNANYLLIPSAIEPEGGVVKNIRFGQNNGARIVFDVEKKVDYDIVKSKNKIEIYVGVDEKPTASPKPTATPRPTKVPSQTPIPGESAPPSFSPSPTPSPEPFYLEIKSTGGRDYVKTNAKILNATRKNSPDRIEFEIEGNELTRKQYQTNPQGNFVQTLEYHPISEGKAKVALYLKCADYSFIQSANEFYIRAQKTAKLRSVTIDAGHGGADGGAVGYDENGDVEALEKDFNLDVALKLRDILKENDVEVHMIREEDIYVDFQQVGSIANDAGSTLFVSVHTNSTIAASAKGIETWAYLEDNASSLNGLTGKRLAELIQKELISSTKAIDRGIKNGKSLAVIRSSSMPAALVEMGFISNTEERHNLMNDNYRQKIADAIAQGVLSAFEEMGI